MGWCYQSHLLFAITQGTLLW